MQDPEAGLAFAETPRHQSCPTLWGIFLLAACLAVVLIGWPVLSSAPWQWPNAVESYTVLLVVIGMALFHLTAMEAVN
jgi:hypothetical protein